MRNKDIQFYMRRAIQVAERSSCERRKVGCVIVKGDREISYGYNGTPASWSNVCETPEGTSKPEVLHAELNSLSKLVRSTESGEGATLFVTTLPCIECAKLIKQSGIEKVYYLDKYRNAVGEDFLIKCGMKPIQVILDDE